MKSKNQNNKEKNALISNLIIMKSKENYLIYLIYQLLFKMKILLWQVVRRVFMGRVVTKLVQTIVLNINVISSAGLV